MDAYVWVDAKTNPAVSRFWSDLETYYIDQDDDLAQAYLRARASSRAIVLLCGDDDFVGRVATYALLREESSLATGLNFAPLWGQSRLDVSHTLARQSGVPRDEKRARRRLDRMITRQHLESIRTPTLRLTSTLSASARLGFTAGFGDIVGVASARAQGSWRGSLTGLASLARDVAQPADASTPDAASRVTFDSVPADLSAVTLISSTSSTWFGIPMGASGVSVRQADSLGEVAKWAARAQVPLSRLRADAQVSRVEIIQWSGAQPYMLDAQVFEPVEQVTCQLCVGPSLHLVDWSTSK